MKKIISLALCLLLVVSLATPAFAESTIPTARLLESDLAPDTVTLKANTKTVYFNGKNYSATIKACYSPTTGAVIGVECEAVITVLISAWTVQYDTHNYGYITDQGGSHTNGFTEPDRLAIYTSYVPCRYGMAQVIKVRHMQASAEFRGSSTCTVAVEYKNY